MPGVLIVEAMAQTAGVLVLNSIPDRESKLVLLVAIESAKFRRPVVPGDQLRIEMAVIKRKASVAKMAGRATVDGVLVAEAEVMCKLADKDGMQPAVPYANGNPSHRGSFDLQARIAETAIIRAGRHGTRTWKSAPAHASWRMSTRDGPTRIGEDNIFFPYSTCGVTAPQGSEVRRRSAAETPHRQPQTASGNLSRFTEAPKAAEWSRASATTTC